MLRHRKKNGQSLIEFVALVMFLLATFLVFQKYLMRGFTGRWKTVGDSLGQERIYDPLDTTECAFDQVHTQKWYNRACYDDKCEDDCLKALGTPAKCETCIKGCSTKFCD